MNVSKINVGMPVQAIKFNAVKSYQSVPMMGLLHDVFQKTTLDVKSAMETLKGIKNENGVPKFNELNLYEINKVINKTPAKYEAIKAMAEIPYVEGGTIEKIAKKDVGVVKEMLDYAKAPAMKDTKEAVMHEVFSGARKGLEGLAKQAEIWSQKFSLGYASIALMEEMIPGAGTVLAEKYLPKTRFCDGELAVLAEDCTAEELKKAKPFIDTKIRTVDLINLAKDKSLDGKHEKLVGKIKEIQDSIGADKIFYIQCEADKENKGSYVITVVDKLFKATEHGTIKA